MDWNFIISIVFVAAFTFIATRVAEVEGYRRGYRDAQMGREYDA